MATLPVRPPSLELLLGAFLQPYIKSIYVTIIAKQHTNQIPDALDTP